MTSSELPLFKIVLCGPAESGKTNVLTRFVNDQFCDQYLRSIGCRCRFKNSEGAELELWDLSDFQPLTEYYRAASAVVLVVDAQSPQLLNDVQVFEAEVRRYSDAPFFIMLNKSDLRPEISKIIVTHLQKYDVPIYQVSACTGANVKESFQHIASVLLESHVKEAEEKTEKSGDSSKEEAKKTFHFPAHEVENILENLKHQSDLEKLVYEMPGLLIKIIRQLGQDNEDDDEPLSRSEAVELQAANLIRATTKKIRAACKTNKVRFVKVKMFPEAYQKFREFFEKDLGFSVGVDDDSEPIITVKVFWSPLK